MVAAHHGRHACTPNPSCITALPAARRPLHTITRFLLLLLFSAILYVPQLRAQDSSAHWIEFGPALSLSAGFNAGSFPVYRGFTDCGVFDNGIGAALRVGATVQWPSLLGRRLGLSARIGWINAAYRYRADPNDEQRLFDAATQTLIDIQREFHYDARMRGVELDLLARYGFSERWSMAIGPSLGYRFRAVFDQTDNVVDPADRSFADGERAHAMQLGAIFSKRSLALGGIVSASFTVPLSKRVKLVPELSLRGDFLSPLLESSWQGISLGAGFSVLYGIPAAAPDSIIPPPAPVDTARPPVPKLRAEITVRGIDEQNQLSPQAVITIREILFRQHTPVLPAVYFEKEAQRLPGRYVMRDAGGSSRFTLLDVAELGALELSHNLLDLIGYRMRETPAAKLTLYGMGSDDEPQAQSLTLARAGYLRDYLVDNWSISKSRIEVRSGPGPLARSDESTSDGRSENRRVTFASDAPSILAPMATERIVRDFNPPRIKLQPVIEAEAGVRRWSITIRQAEKVLASFEGTGNDATSPLRSELLWRLSDERIDSAAGNLTAELFVEDSAGQTTTASDRVALILRRDSTIVETGREQRGEIERLSYALVGFGYRSATGDREHERRLQELADRIRDNAQVKITGYTDRIGDDNYNLDLSRERAEYMAARLRELTASQGIHNVEFITQGAGAETERYPNDLPEGRVLSRGATALVEQRPESGDR